MRPFRMLHVMIIGGSFLVILVGATWLINSWRDDAEKERKDLPAKAGADKDKNGKKEPEKPREDPAILEVKQAQAKVRMQAILNMKTEVSEQLTSLEHEVIAWETRIPGLMTSDEGKKIAVNPARVQQFAGVVEKDRVSKARVKQLREQLETLSAPVERAIREANRIDFPANTLLPDIENIDKEVRTKLRELKEIKVVIDTIQADSVLTPRGEKTLEKALAELEAEKARKRGEMISKARSDEHDSESKRLAAAEAKAEKDLADARLKLLQARTEAEKQGIDFQIEDAKRKAEEAKAAEQKRVEKAKREARFDAEYLAMKNYLMPFTSSGLKQFKGNELHASTTKGPMSFSCFQGLLKKDPNGTEALARSITRWNDRPRGSFPECPLEGNFSSSRLETWYRVQDFLAEFGEIMVERKLLAP